MFISVLVWNIVLGFCIVIRLGRNSILVVVLKYIFEVVSEIDCDFLWGGIYCVSIVCMDGKMKF